MQARKPSRERGRQRDVRPAPEDHAAHPLRIRRRPLHEEVVERLRDMIVEGSIVTGERLNESVLAETLGVSRTPIREALKLLASEGIIELLPNRGGRVVEMSSTEIAELFEVVSGIERHAAELTAQRITRQEFEKLKALHERMEVHFKNRNRREYAKLNNEVHLMIVALSGNETLRGIHRGLLIKARRVRYFALELEERWREAFDEHVALMDALRRNDGKKAGTIMLAHVRETGETALNMFLEQERTADRRERAGAES
jgi:DNA-binding GntR family transcriptional regulator